MKKFILIFCLAAMIILASCSNKTEAPEKSEVPAEETISSEAEKPAEKEDSEEPSAEKSSSGLTEQQISDIAYAKKIVDEMAISRASLLDYLFKEGLNSLDAEFAADHCGADWNAEALQAAKQIVEEQGIKAEKEYILLHLTEAHGFTEEEANYGADTYLAGK